MSKFFEDSPTALYRVETGRTGKVHYELLQDDTNIPGTVIGLSLYSLSGNVYTPVEDSGEIEKALQTIWLKSGEPDWVTWVKQNWNATGKI